MAIKGYVVRGKHSEGGGDVWLVYEPTGEHLIASRKAQRTEFQSLGSAIQAWADAQVLCDEASIFRVLDDGREERLPSYEEALAMLGADPLAALEAAERRLLEAGGWTPGDRGFWVDPDDGTQWPREGAISDVRRRLAAKGGV